MNHLIKNYGLALSIILLSLALLSCQKPPLGELNLKPLVNKATKEDIKNIFGAPDSVTEDRGETIYLYIITHKEKVDSMEYNAATGRRQLTSRTLSQWSEVVLMRFDKQGILRYWSVEKI